MGSSSVDEVHFLDSTFQSFESGSDFGNHPSGNSAILDEVESLRSRDGFDESGLVCRIAKEARDVGEID